MGKNNLRSFTLIEILVVTSITVLLSGFSIAVFNTYKEDRVLDVQISQFKRAIDLARAKAQAGDTSSCTDSANAYATSYDLTVDGTSIQINPHCNTSPTPIVLPLDAQSVFVTPTFSLSFGSHNYEGQTACIPIKNLSGSLCKYVKIDETGIVSDGSCTSCLPQVVCPCP